MARKKVSKTPIHGTVPWSLMQKAMDMAGDDWKLYLDAAETKIVEIPEDPYLSDDPDGIGKLAEEVEEGFRQRYWPLPDARVIREFDMMQAFAAGVEDAKARDRLEKALQGRGAYRKFKDALYACGLDAKWYSYRDKRFRKIAREWCEDHGFSFKDDVAEDVCVASIKAPDGKKTDGMLPANGLLKLEISGINGFMAGGEGWEEKLSMTKGDISYQYEPVRTSSRIAKGWRYETDSDSFAVQFALAGEALARIINGEPVEGWEELPDVEVLAVYEDGTKYHGIFFSSELEFRELFTVVKRMIPACEKMPVMLAALDD